MSGAIPPLDLYAFMPWTGTNLLYLYHYVTTVTNDCYEKLSDNKGELIFYVIK
jgi:hypothetical protein